MTKALNISYEGNFPLPPLRARKGPFVLDYSRGPLAYWDGKLLVVGSDRKTACWFRIPEPGGIAEEIGEPFDPTFGKLDAYVQEVKEITHRHQTFRVVGFFFDEEDHLNFSISAWYNVKNDHYLTLGQSDLKARKSYGLWAALDFASLEWGGYLCPLSPELQKATGYRHGCGETIAQGVSESNHGPALYAFTMPAPKTPHAMRIPSKPLLEYTKWVGKSYPDYYPSWYLRSVVDLPNHVVWAGRRGRGRNGYGEKNKLGWTSTCGGLHQGYHSERYQPTFWIVDHASLLAQQPRIVEQDLSEWIKTPCAFITMTADLKTNRLYVLESNAAEDEMTPIVHIFQTES